MRRNSLTYLSLIVMGMMIVTLAACTGGGGSSRQQIPSLTSPDGVTGKAAAKNNEGVDHLVQGHYDIAMKHLKEALAAKPDFAEAHFNMGVAFDGMGKHADATASFEKAKKFAGGNQKIVGNAILKKHLNL